MNQYDYIDAGLRVFGLYKINKDGSCGCGNQECKTAGKHPLASNWQHSPEWSDEQLEVMEMSGQFETGFGVLVKGLLVIDVDARNGGVESFSRLCADTGLDLLGDSGFAVRTGSGGGSMHIYYRAPAEALMQTHNSYKGIDFKSSGYIVGAGSLHSSGSFYEEIHGHPDAITDAPQPLLDILKKPDMHRADYHGSPMDVTDEDLAHMLSFVSPDCDHETWYRCGMALHHATGGTGFHIWDAWSNQSSKYPGRGTLEKRWHSFGKSANPVTLGTLAHYAEDGGWSQSVEFVSDASFSDEEAPDGLPFSIEGVDLLRPPGMVGQVCQWINAQCRYPREHLSVAASLVAMGNVCGLRYTDDLDGVSANLFAFCVAGSGTGKESVQQAMAEIHRAAGIAGATHGAIKSEQEVIRNLIRNQAALYIIDEIGIFLQKISNAQKKGGAAYLDGVIGILMSAYSKADGFMLLTGDTKDDVRKALMAELGQCRKLISENEDHSGSMARRVPQLERALEHIDNGLERPFLSLIGFTTPVTFDGLVTHEQATNGFIGRSLLVNDKETNPRARRGFKKQPMGDQLRYALSSLYSGGSYDPQASRVEYYGDKQLVRTDKEAAAMLGRALDWIEDHAEMHKERTGLEAVVRRGYELMAKISLILAAPGGVRTAEHVRWAFAMMRRDIEEKTRLAYANMTERSNPNDALAAKILNMIDTDHGETVAVMYNRTKRPKAEIQKVLDKLQEAGQVVERVTKHPANGKEVRKWFSS